MLVVAEQRAVPRVVVVGSVHTDYVATAGRLPMAGETLPGVAFAVHPGGKGGNQAIAVSRAGGRAVFLGRVGADAAGDALGTALAAKGVDVNYLGRDPDRPTGASAVLVGEAGDYASVIVPGAGLGLGADLVAAQRTAFAGAAVAIGQLETPAEGTREAFAIARSSGARTLLNAAPADRRMDGLADGLLALVDVLVVNRVEASMLLESNHAELEPMVAAETLRRRTRCGTVVVTAGAAGAAVSLGSERWMEPGRDVAVRDAIGAGDVFVGYLAAGLAQAMPVRLAIRRANAAASIAVTRPGAYDAAPAAADVDALLGAEPAP